LYNNVDVINKATINGASGYNLIVDGTKIYATMPDAINYVKNSATSNATVVKDSFLRLKRGHIGEQTIITTCIERNGMTFINPLADVSIDERKFTEYLLNPSHEKGKHKARIYDSILGFNLSNYRQLIDAIRDGLSKYPITKVQPSEYGLKYTIDMKLTGLTGKTVVITGWIEMIEGKLRLVSAYVKI